MIGRLKRRREFLAAAGGQKTARAGFLLQALKRDDDDVARFGFTVSKHTAASAVERNRIRRRLKEAVRLIADKEAAAGHDYVVVGRRDTLREPFEKLKEDLAGALHRLSSEAWRKAPGTRKRSG
jgi:ribonuclease P protein component